MINRIAKLAGIAVACALAAACSVLDGLSDSGDSPGNGGGPGGGAADAGMTGPSCASDEDCRVPLRQACSVDGCFEFVQFGFLFPCFSDGDCNGADTIDLTCPFGTCRCLEEATTCVVESASCTSNQSCGPLEFCHAETRTCMQPYGCVTHDDCPGDLCAMEGCIGDDDTIEGTFCGFNNPCQVGQCLSGRCFTDGGAACTTSRDCVMGSFCAFETSTCFTPI